MKTKAEGSYKYENKYIDFLNECRYCGIMDLKDGAFLLHKRFEIEISLAREIHQYWSKYIDKIHGDLEGFNFDKT